MYRIKQLFKKLGYLTFFLNIYFTYAQTESDVIKNHSALNELIDESAKVEKLSGDFVFTEGPVWSKKGYLLFTDIPKNSIMKWTKSGQVSVFRNPSFNSNGLTFDKKGNLVMCEHSGRKVSQLSAKGEYSTIVDNYNGKKFNSPNDVAIKSDGSYYFTDPPYGLPEGENDTTKELSFNGVYRYSKGKLELLDSTLSRPNGIAFSNDEKFLYVANSENPKIVRRYEVQKDGSVKNPTTFFDVSSINLPGGPDGIKVDVKGNVYCTGPGGVLVFSPEGIHLGSIRFPEIPANLAFGDTDMKTLFVTARTGLYKVKVKVAGVK